MKPLPPDTGDSRSHPCMHCGVTTPGSAFCDGCGGVYCDNHLPDGAHHCAPCTDREAEA